MLKQTYERKSSVDHQPFDKIIVGIAGGSAAGKTTLCQNIAKYMAFDKNFKAQLISLDCFYKSIDTKQVDVKEYNFDHPNALDFDLAYETLIALKHGRQRVEIPQYSFTEHRRLETVTYSSPANIIFFEGLMAFHDKRIRDLMTYKIFIHCDDDIRLCRRLKRDVAQRGRTIISVLHQYNKFVKPAFRDFIYPTITYADLIIPGSRNNRVSVNFIVQHIKTIAKHINFREQVKKTKTFCFGQNQFYDLEYKNTSSSNPQMKMVQSSFLVFPTSEETKRQLHFYLSQNLLNESFTYKYFCEIYSLQFARILKDLFIQFMSLKKYNKEQIEFFSIYDLNELFASPDNEKNIKVIFIPSILNIDSKNLLLRIKDCMNKKPKMEVILLNIFSDMDFPTLIYELEMKNTVLINLFIITNEKRFSETMISKALFEDPSFSWLTCNQSLTQSVVQNLCDSLKISHALDIQNQVNTYDFIVEKFNKQNQNQNQTQKALVLNEEVHIDNFVQLPMYPQQHGNLCGYHALNGIICQSNEQLKSKQIFINNYHKLTKLIISYYPLKQFLRRTNYQPLERNDLQFILSFVSYDHKHDLFAGKHITTFFYCSGYIQNEQKQLLQFSGKIHDLVQGVIQNLFIIMGVLDHYFLVKLTGGKIFFMDCLNTSLKQLLQIGQNSPATNKQQKRKKWMSKSLKIIKELYINKRNIYTIMIQQKTKIICTQFFQFKKGGPQQIQKWFTQEYTVKVLKDDLLYNLNNQIVKDMKQDMRNLLERFIKDEDVVKRMGTQMNNLFA